MMAIIDEDDGRPGAWPCYGHIWRAGEREWYAKPLGQEPHPSRFSTAVFAAGFLLNAPGISKLVTIPGLTPASYSSCPAPCARATTAFSCCKPAIRDGSPTTRNGCAPTAPDSPAACTQAGSPPDLTNRATSSVTCSTGAGLRSGPTRVSTRTAGRGNILHSHNNPALAAELGQGFTVGEDDAKAAVQKWVDGYDAVTIDWTETVARSATFTRAQLASVWPVTPADVIPGSDLAGLLADAAVDMDSDVATIRTTITDVTEGSD